MLALMMNAFMLRSPRVYVFFPVLPSPPLSQILAVDLLLFCFAAITLTNRRPRVVFNQ